MTSAISETLTFIREHNIKTILVRIRQRKVPALMQFFVYALCGGLATVVCVGMVTILSLTIFPAVKNMEVNGVVLDERVRKYNLILNNVIAFPFGCLVAYYSNILLVFTPGRHSKLKEFLLFFLVAACGFFPGLWIIDFLVGKYGVPSSLAQLAFVFTSFIVNFLMRKFVIFKG